MSRTCARPGCSAVAGATLSYRYDAMAVWIEQLHAEAHPATHDLCRRHVDSLSVPIGWTKDDRRARSGLAQAS